MKLENQVCSLELSKKLKELGVKQLSVFYWNIEENKVLFYPEKKLINLLYNISAFTVAELGEMLPDYVELSKVQNIHLATVYSDDNGTENNVSVIGETEANVRAQILIYLIENNLISHF